MTTPSPPLSPTMDANGPELVLIVTGDHDAGKDFCASVWADQVFSSAGFSARVASISDATKREYAAATGADLTRLLQDRAYKEEHRAGLAAFFDDQVRRRPTLPGEHFRDVVHESAGVNVLLITGIRDEAPVAMFAHLAAGSRVLEVRVVTTELGKARRQAAFVEGREKTLHMAEDVDAQLAALSHRPELVFVNDLGSDYARHFAAESLLPLLDPDYSRLAALVRAVPDFPRSGIEFRHVFNVVQTPGGLSLCTRLLADRAAHNIDAFVCCESGGFLFAAALAVDDPGRERLVLMRRAGKLPPPVISEHKAQSHISSETGDGVKAVIEMDATLLQPSHRVLVVDDVLSSGTTLCAMLRLLAKAGVPADHVDVLVVVEFPAHRGRYNVRRAGFGKVKIQSLLTFAGA